MFGVTLSSVLVKIVYCSMYVFVSNHLGYNASTNSSTVANCPLSNFSYTADNPFTIVCETQK